MITKIKILFSIFTLIIICSCERDELPKLIQAGIETRVSGNIISLNGESLTDVEIKIGEYVETTSGGCFNCPAPTNYHYEFKGWVKRVNLFENGDFDFTFKTTGKGNFYKLFVGDLPEPRIELGNGQGYVPFFEQKIDDPLGINLTQKANDLTIIGKEFSFNHALKKLYRCEVSLQFNLTNNYTITPFHSLTFGTNNREINSFINPTTVILFIDKSSTQTLILKRNREGGISQKAEYVFPASNVEITTFQNVIVNEADFVDY